MSGSLRFLLPFLVCLNSCKTSLPTIPGEWMKGPAEAGPTSISAVEFDSGGGVRAVAGPRRVVDSGVRVVRDGEGVKLMRGETALTPVFKDIESFDVSQSRQEVAFSAKRDTNFDIGLATLEGSAVSWVPEDPADEEGVTWAPRGNKISYFVRGAGGDIVRTVHVPTSVALVIDFPFSTLRSLVWDAPAERFAVTVESVNASPHVETMRYGGEERRIAIPPAVRVPGDVAPLGPHALLLQPPNLRYGEKVPLVVWIASGSRNEWSDARGRLLNSVRAGCVVTDRAPDEALWKSIADLAWVDQTRTYIVNTTSNEQPATSNQVQIIGDASIPPGRYQRTTKLIRVQPSDIESFAAGFIADQLKGTSLRGH